MIRKVLLSIGAATIVLVAIVYVGFPSLFHTIDLPPIDVDYSDRYYELAAKKTLTESEFEEFKRERAKGDAAIRKAIEERRGGDQVPNTKRE